MAAQIGRNLPFPFLEELRKYIRSIQSAYGIRLYTIRCVPTSPKVTEIHGTITFRAPIPIGGTPPSIYYYKYRYSIAGDNGETYSFDTLDPSYTVGGRVILTLRDDTVHAMRKESQTIAVAAIMARPRLLVLLSRG